MTSDTRSFSCFELALNLRESVDKRSSEQLPILATRFLSRFFCHIL